MVYNELKKVTSAKLLGLTTSSNLTSNDHISDIINKASKRLYFFGAAKEIESSLAGYIHFLLCLYTALFLLTLHPPFLCPAKVPKRRVGASLKASNVYNMPRMTPPGGYPTGEHCSYSRFHHRAM